MRLHARGKFTIIKRSEIDDEIIFDGEDGIRSQPRVIFGVDLRDAGFISLLCDHEMNVCGTHRVAV